MSCGEYPWYVPPGWSKSTVCVAVHSSYEVRMYACGGTSACSNSPRCHPSPPFVNSQSCQPRRLTGVWGGVEGGIGIDGGEGGDGGPEAQLFWIS
eukprot:5674882-Pleurochrysis_carterae.AAC.2